MIISYIKSMCTPGILICCLFFLNSQLLLGNDEVLEYTYDLVKEQEQKGKPESDSFIDENYKAIASSYFKMGYREKALTISLKVEGAFTRYELLKDLIQQEQDFKTGIFAAIKKQINKVEPKIFRAILWSELILHCIETKREQDIDELFANLNRITASVQNTDNDKYEFLLGNSIALVSPFIGINRRDLSGKILKELESYLQANSQFELMLLLLDKYLQLNRLENANGLLKKKKKIYKAEPGSLFKLSVMLLKMERYDDAEILLENAFKVFTCYEKPNTQNSDDLAGFLHLNGVLDLPIVLERMAKNKTIVDIITKCLAEIPNPQLKKARVLDNNDTLTHFLIATGHYKEALEKVQTLDKKYKIGMYKDYYYYQLGLLYAKSHNIEAMNRVTQKIKTVCLAVDLLIRVAGYYRKTGKWAEFKRVMNLATLRVSKKSKIKYFFFGDVGDVTMAWLEGGFLKKAIETLEYVKYEKALLLFEVAQRYVQRYNISKALAIVEKIDKKYCKSKALSKIASQLLLTGNKKKAISYFKKAIRLEISGKGGVSGILRDYVNARVNGRFSRSSIWKNRYVVD